MQSRQVEIEQQQVGQNGGDRAHGGKSVRGVFRVVASLPEQHEQACRQRLMILGNQDARCHYPPGSSARRDKPKNIRTAQE